MISRWQTGIESKFPSLLIPKLRALAALIALCLILFGSFGSDQAHAKTMIVALGASNVEGWRISGPAFPELLQAKLRSLGQDVTVINEGRAWDSSSKMLNRLSTAVPNDTSIVILADNIRQSTNRFMGQIESRLRSRGIKVIRINFRNIASAFFQPDGIHLTESGQQLVASRLVRQVMSVIKRETKR